MHAPASLEADLRAEVALAGVAPGPLDVVLDDVDADHRGVVLLGQPQRRTAHPAPRVEHALAAAQVGVLGHHVVEGQQRTRMAAVTGLLVAEVHGPRVRVEPQEAVVEPGRLVVAMHVRRAVSGGVRCGR